MLFVLLNCVVAIATFENVDILLIVAKIRSQMLPTRIRYIIHKPIRTVFAKRISKLLLTHLNVIQNRKPVHDQKKKRKEKKRILIQ